ncbi:MAG TPA: ATP-grasp domain-containing protein, partial [Bacillales bacterium]
MEGLEQAGVPVLGVNQKIVDELEDRDLFYRFMEKVQAPHIPGLTAFGPNDLLDKACQVGYPVLLRPSYVIGGRGMVILSSRKELEHYMAESLTNISYPILIDAYVPGTEAEVDVLTDGENVLIPGIFEHMEKAGVHSGDSTAVTPPYSLSTATKNQLVDYTKRIAQAMDFKGIFNIQFVINGGDIYILEINPRASRTVPILSKVYGIDMVGVAVKLMLGNQLSELGLETGLLPETAYYTTKAPVFSTIKLAGVDPLLGPEMKSTGEVISMAESVEKGTFKATGIKIKPGDEIFCEIDRENWDSFQQLSDLLYEAGAILVSDQQRFGRCFGLTLVSSYGEWLQSKHASILISIGDPGNTSGKEKRLSAIRHGLTVLTEWTQVKAILRAEKTEEEPGPIGEWLRKNERSGVH